MADLTGALSTLTLLLAAATVACFHGVAQENVAAYTHRTAGGTEIEVRGRCRSTWMRYEDQKMSGWMGLPGCDCMAAVNLGLVCFWGLIPTGTNPAEARASRSLTCG